MLFNYQRGSHGIPICHSVPKKKTSGRVRTSLMGDKLSFTCSYIYMSYDFSWENILMRY